MILKRCSKCGIEKPLEDFYRTKHGKNNYHSECKECNKIRDAQYREANKKTISKRRRKYRENNKKLISKRRRKYYEAHKKRTIETEA